MKEKFNKFAAKISSLVGSPYASITAFVMVLAWIFGGFVFGFGDIYQLLANTTTTLVTFLMVFIIQNSQNIKDKAIHLKLDELIRSNKEARNNLIGVENDDEVTMSNLQNDMTKIKKEFDISS